MNFVNTIIPISVVSAVMIFILKEFLEYARRKSAEKRRSLSYRKLLKRECEINAFAIKSLKSISGHVKDNFEHGLEFKYEMQNNDAGRTLIRYESDLAGWGSRRLPSIILTNFEKLMPSIAENDPVLFSKLEPAYDEMINVKHIIDSLVDFITTEDENIKVFFDSFPDYALSEIVVAEETLTAPYKECTGKNKIEPRVR